MCTSMSLQNITLISMFALILFFYFTAKGDFLLRSGGLKISSMIPSQNVKLILRGLKIVFKKFNGFRDENNMSVSSACCYL